MFKFYAILLISTLISSCGSRLNYLGKTLPPTETVDIYVDAAAIKRGYTIVGKGYMEGFTVSKRGYDRMQKKALRMAKEKGADAILFQDYYYTENSGNVYNVTRTDSVGHGLVSVPNNAVNAVLSSRTDILFLKYE
jgi:hypothetical protein